MGLELEEVRDRDTLCVPSLGKTVFPELGTQRVTGES
jgi:hypothetical protein